MEVRAKLAAYKEYKKLGLSQPFSSFLSVAYEGAHDAKPNEIKADLDALRYKMWKKGIYDTSKGDMTNEDYKKMSQDKEIKNSLEFKRLSERFKPSDIVILNNKIAMNSVKSPQNSLFT